MHLKLTIFSEPSAEDDEHEYFFIENQMSGKVLDGRLGMGVMIWENCGFDTQLWFWDGESIRNKKHPSHVLDLDHRVSFNIGSSTIQKTLR